MQELKEKNTTTNSTLKDYTLHSEVTINIEGYNKLTKIGTSNYYRDLERNAKEDVLTSMKFEDQVGKKKLSNINILNEIQNWIDNYSTYKDRNQALEIVINENQKIILTDINIEMNGDNVEFCNMSGFLLEKYVTG